MADIEIHLCRDGNPDPVATLECDYDALARMSDRTLANRIIDHFGDFVEPIEQTLVVVREGRDVWQGEAELQTTWSPIYDDPEQLQHELEIQANNLVKEWRE